MSKLASLVVLGLLLFGCGRIEDIIDGGIERRENKNLPEMNIESEFVPLIDDFKVEAANHGINPIHFDKLRVVHWGYIKKYNTLARCIVYTGNKGRVVHTEILFNEDRKTVINLTNIFGKVVMFHELGHCILGKRHEDESYLIMSAVLSHHATRYYRDYWEDLLNQFFLDIDMP